MKTLFLVLGALAAKCGTEPWTHLTVNFYHNYPLPKKVSDIKGGEYVLMAHDKELNVDLYSYPGDPRVSVLFDTHGNVAGVRTAYITADLGTQFKADFPNYYKQAVFSRGTYWGTALDYTTVLFLNPEKLKAGGRADTKGLVAEDLYLPLEGKWTKLPKDECQAEALGFVKQNCYPGMGGHYTWKMSASVPNKDNQGMTLIYNYGQLVGVAINPFGGSSSKNRPWFEKYPGKVVKATMPNSPADMSDIVDNYGSPSLHVYLNSNPKGIVCTAPAYIPNRCATKPGKYVSSQN